MFDLFGQNLSFEIVANRAVAKRYPGGAGDIPGTVAGVKMAAAPRPGNGGCELHYFKRVIMTSSPKRVTIFLGLMLYFNKSRSYVRYLLIGAITLNPKFSLYEEVCRGRVKPR